MHVWGGCRAADESGEAGVGGLAAEQMQGLGLEDREDLRQLQGEGLEGARHLGPWLDILSGQEYVEITRIEVSDGRLMLMGR